jgi:hypothetical protein
MTRTAWVSHFANLQESGPMKTFTVHCEYPAHYRAEITVEAEDVVSACRSAIDASHTTDGWKSLDTEHPTWPLCIVGTQIHGSGLMSSGMRPLASRSR